jgi:capsular polysaccharide export protein
MLPLLRAPPFAKRYVAISRRLSAWEDLPAEPESSSQALARAVIAGRVGGEFWLPAKPIQPASRGAGARRTLVVVPRHPVIAQELWRASLERAEAGKMLVVFPCLDRHAAGLARRVIESGGAVTEVADPHSLLDGAERIHVVELGDLAWLGLLAGCEVLRAGPAGFEPELPGRACAMLSAGTAYRNPYSGAAADCAETIDLLRGWRRMILDNRRIAVCSGITLWKRRRIGQLLDHGSGGPVFRHTARAALAAAKSRGGGIAVWSSRMPDGLETRAAAAGVALYKMEDGFVRSAGLGSDFLPPASIVLDSRGDYFDPARPSDLEHLLASIAFDEELLLRARKLIAQLIKRGIGKYATGGAAPPLHAKAGQRILLVPGQVADDLSVIRGGGDVRGNAALLAQVRAANPESFIIYRPHPDVLAGHRRGAIPGALAEGLADQISEGGAIAPLIDRVDEVHTLTSLTGFEALIRGRHVETYGQPFYAGWGLTVDHAPVNRRRRRLSLEELVAATLILYPLYLDPATGLPCEVETLISRLEDARFWQPSLLMRLRRIQGRLRAMMQQRRLAQKLP